MAPEEFTCESVRRPEEMDAFVDRSPQGSFWASSSWTKLVSRSMEEPVEITVCREGSTPVAACFVSVRARLGFSYAHRPFATPFAGIQLAPGVDEQTARRAVSRISAHVLSRHHLVELTHHPTFDLSDELSRLGWQVTPRATMELDLSDTGELWRRFDCDLRNIVRKADRSSVTFSRADDIDAFYDLYDLTFQKHSPITIRRRQLGEIISGLRESGRGELYLALDADGHACAGAVMVWDNDTAYYFLAASHPQLRRNGAPSGLLWHIIQEFSGRCKTLDLVGANVPSIAQFKSQFRPRLVEYSMTSRYRNGLRKTQHRWYRRLKGQSVDGGGGGQT